MLWAASDHISARTMCSDCSIRHFVCLRITGTHVHWKPMMPTAIATTSRIYSTFPVPLPSGLHSGPSHTRQTHTYPLNTFYVFNLGVQKIRVDSKSTSHSGRMGGGGLPFPVSILFVGTASTMQSQSTQYG